jgi:Carboxypeptidase regulatory-like domain
MHRSHHLFNPSTLAVAVAIVCAAPAYAQNTTAVVNGQVVGADGAPVAAASVTLVHVDSGTTTRLTTDAQGRFSARGLRVGGPYTVTVSKGGATEQRTDVFLALADTTTLDLTLQTAQRVVVTGRSAPRLDRSQMGAGTQISNRDLNTQASISGNLQDFARADPRLAQTDKERGEISAAGQNSRYNAITIDSVRINDSFGLESNNLPTLKQPIPLDAVQSVQVNISNYDVTQAGYTGANINAVTKSGTNQFKGSVRYSLRDDGLSGLRFNRTNGTYNPPPVFSENSQVFTLGGPIIQDKLFFFAAFESLKSSRNTPQFGPIGGSLTNVGLTPAFIDRVRNVARDTYGLAIGDFNATSSELTVEDTVLKLDWNISDSHRANLRYTKTDQSEPVYPGFGQRSLAVSSHWYDQVKSFDSLVGQWFADWTPDFSTELKLSRRNVDSAPDVNARMPQVTIEVTQDQPTGGVPTGTRSLVFGTERSRHFNELATETSEAYFGGSLRLGAHELKGGVELIRNQIFNAFLQDTFGQYTFTGTTYDNAVALFTAGQPSRYQVQTAATGFTLDDGVARWKLGNNALFLQDTWKVNKDLSLMLGLRVDQLDQSEQTVRNSSAAAPAVAGVAPANLTTPGTRATGGFGLDNTLNLDGTKLVQPRLGFNWAFRDLVAKGLQGQLRGGFGMFQGAAANVWLSNPYSNTGIATRVLSCTSFAGCASVRFNGDPNNQPALVGTPPAANVDFLASNLRQPSVWKFNLGLDHDLPWFGLVAGAEVLHTKTKDGIYYRHLNLGTPTARGSDGRDLFYNPQGYNAACWTTGGVGITSGACATPSGQRRDRALSNVNFNNVLEAVGTEKGGGTAVTLSLSRPLSDGLSWSAAYTRTSAKEVSPLTSSVSNSNWAARSIFNPNEEVSANSTYLVRDRVNASWSWSKSMGGPGFRTSVGVFYEGRRGRPYSWTYFNDLNGDGLGGNDLMYIPSAPGSNEVVFLATPAAGSIPAYTAAQNEARFWDVVNANSSLSSARGGVTKRNTAYSPMINSFDVRLAQEIPGFAKDHKMTFSFNILNFGNLLNNRWGRTDEISFQSNGGPARSFVNYAGLDAQGRYIYALSGTVEDLVTRQERGESQWAMQISLKYDF